jgi:GNAT superfamily N-acetyltransferase
MPARCRQLYICCLFHFSKKRFFVALELHILTQKSEMLPLCPLLQQLSPTVTPDYLDHVLDDMLAHGYRMAVVREGAGTLAVSGVWVGTKIYSGKYLEMDNVVVDAAHRSRGLGQLLTDFVTDLARREGCQMMMLDAYRENEGAHAFYERNGFVKRGYHFLKKMD